MIDITVTYKDNTKAELHGENISASELKSLEQEGKEIEDISVRFSSDSQTLDGNSYTDFTEKKFKSIEELAVHLGQ